MEYILNAWERENLDKVTPFEHKDDGWQKTGSELYSRGWWFVNHTRGGESKIYMARNLINTIGKAQIAGLINGVATLPFKAIGFGVGTTAPAAGDTALVTEKDAANTTTTTHVCPLASSTNTRLTTTTTNDTAEILSQVITITATMALAETGVFDANIAGNMICRAASGGGTPAFPVINVIANDTVQLRWRIQLT